MSWLVFVFISVCLGAVTRLAQRVLLGTDKSDPVAFAIVFQAFTGLIMLVWALINGFVFPDFEKYWLAITSCVILFGLGNIALAKSLQKIEASVFTIIFATSSVWIMLFGIIIFGENLSILHLIGAFLTFVSIGLLVERKGNIQFDHGVVLGLLSALLMASGVVGWIYVGRRTDPISWQAITFIAPAAFIALISPKSIEKAKPLLSGDKALKTLLASATFGISTLALLYAYNEGDITQVAPLSQTTIIVTVILAVIFLNERKNLVRKFISAAICFVGVLLIVS